MKSDVFSFRVLTLEIVSRRRNTSFTYHDKTVNLIAYAWELWLQGDALELEDPTLVDTHVIHHLSKIIHVALLCVQENALDRLVMSDVVSMLTCSKAASFFLWQNCAEVKFSGKKVRRLFCKQYDHYSNGGSVAYHRLIVAVGQSLCYY